MNESDQAPEFTPLETEVELEAKVWQCGDPNDPRYRWTNHCFGRWVGLSTCHCPSCHLTFSAPSSFKRHRVFGRCIDPSTLDMREIPRGNWNVWAGRWEESDADAA